MIPFPCSTRNTVKSPTACVMDLMPSINSGELKVVFNLDEIEAICGSRPLNAVTSEDSSVAETDFIWFSGVRLICTADAAMNP